MTVTTKKKVVITGVRGFVGRNLLRYLSAQGKFHITGASGERENLSFLDDQLDAVVSYDQLYMGEEKFDIYLHLAGKVIHEVQDRDDQEYIEVNSIQTQKVYDTFLRDGRAAAFIFTSTIHVITERPDRVVDEAYTPQPFTPYGRSKFEAENYIQEKSVKDKNYYILRPSMMHGPGNKGNLNLLYGLVSRGIPYPLGRVNNRRSFVSIDNFSFIVNELIEQLPESGLYHIADDEPTCTHDLIRLIAESRGRKARMVNIPLSLLRLTAFMARILPFIPLNEHRLLKLTEDFIVSNKKIKEAIGKPLPVRAEEGLRKTLESFRV